MLRPNGGHRSLPGADLHYLKRRLSFIAIEETQPAQVLSVFALHANLDELVFEQNAIVLEQEPENGGKMSKIAL